jgi:uncharacterized protein YjbI with pentapeptide repeats
MEIKSNADLLSFILNEKNINNDCPINFSGCDLSSTKFDIDIITSSCQKILEKNDFFVSNWAMRGYSQLLNLRYANFEGAILRNSSFKGVDFCGAIFNEADMRDCSFVSCNFFQAKLCKTRLRRSTFKNCNAAYTDFSNSNLFRSYLLDSDFRHSNLKETDLGQIIISNSDITKVSFGKFILHERVKQFENQLISELKPDTHLVKANLDERYNLLRDIYRQLRCNFLQFGYYDDASWAYFRQRVNDRKSYWIKARKILQAQDSRPIDKIQNVLSCISNCVKLMIIEISCGYGEKPSNVFASSILIIFLFACLYSTFNAITQNALTSSSPFFDSITYSISAFTTYGLTRLEPANSAGEVITVFEGFFGFLMLSLLMFTIGNKINR